MRISLGLFWQNTQGQKVDAGEHDARDLPDGIAEYLVKHGHAVVVTEDVYPVGVKVNPDNYEEDVAAMADIVMATPKLKRTRRKKKTS